MKLITEIEPGTVSETEVERIAGIVVFISDVAWVSMTDVLPVRTGPALIPVIMPSRLPRETLLLPGIACRPHTFCRGPV